MSKCAHRYEIIDAYQYVSPVGETTKAICQCSLCGHQFAGGALKGCWTVEELKRVPAHQADRRVPLFGWHRHTFFDCATFPYYALGGPHTRVLQRCNCGMHRCVTAKGHIHAEVTTVAEPIPAS